MTTTEQTAPAVVTPSLVIASPVFLLLHTVECVVCQRRGGLLDPVLGLVHHVDADEPCELPGRVW